MSNNLMQLLPRILEMLMPVFVFLLTLLFGYVFRKIIINRLHQWSKKTTTKLDDIIIDSLRKPIIIWFLMVGIYFGIQAGTYPDNLERIVNKVLIVLGILSVTIALSSFSSRLIKVYSAKFESALPVTSLTQNISRILIFCVGILIILNALGISIAPILATLGVGGLAVALALQDTLSNLFAGFHIIASRQIKVGDFIKLENGDEGYVTDINWRTTKIRLPANNTVLVPNDKLSKSIVTNYYLPAKEMAVTVSGSVHYGSDLEKVERVTVEVAKEVMQDLSDGVSSFEPVVRFSNFSDSGVQFSVAMQTKEFTGQYLIKHEFIKRLHRRYAKEGIIIPYPVRAINYSQEKAKE